MDARLLLSANVSESLSEDRAYSSCASNMDCRPLNSRASLSHCPAVAKYQSLSRQPLTCEHDTSVCLDSAARLVAYAHVQVQALTLSGAGIARLSNFVKKNKSDNETGSDAGLFCVGPVFFALRGNALKLHSGSSKACHSMDWRCAA